MRDSVICVKKVEQDHEGRDVYQIVPNKYVEDIFVIGQGEYCVDMDGTLYSLFINEPFLPMYKLSEVTIL